MSVTTSGFILTRHWSDRVDNGQPSNRVTLWIKTDSHIIKANFDQQKPIFFLAEPDHLRSVDLLSKQIHNGSIDISESQLVDFKHRKIISYYFKQQKTLYQTRSILKEHSIFPYEADIQPSERFLMERFITGAVDLEYSNHKIQNNYIEVDNPRIRPSECRTNYKVTSLDIETSMNGKSLYSIGLSTYHYQQDNDSGVKDFENTVYMIGPTDTPIDHSNKHYQLVYVDNEASLIDKLNQYMLETDPDIITGWNVINFDFRVLQQCSERLKTPLTIGRDKSQIEWRQSLNDGNHYTIKITGRLVLDGIDTMRSATYNFDSFSLNNIAANLLNEKKLLEGNDRGAEITTLYNQDKIALADYNIQDCILVAKIFDKAKLIEFAVERAQLTGLAMDRFGGSVASFDNRYLPLLHRQGFIAPNIPQYPTNVGSPGGYVMESLPGLYDHVLVLDFKSLYPSIIRTFSIDPMSLIIGETSPDYAGSDKYQQETPVSNLAEYTPGFNGALFSKTHHILPSLIEELWAARDKAKQQNNKAMSQAIKILMNSFYGVLGTPGCRFFDYRLPSSITLRGHEILYKTKDVIESKGYKVIYGDTDSVFVWLKGYHRNIAAEEIRAIGTQLASELNDWWRDYLNATYQIDCHLELEFETHYKRFVMPTIRGSDKGSKKRYAGLIKLASGEEKIIFKGLESVRTDWTEFAKDFQQTLYHKIFFDQPYQQFIRDTVKQVHQGSCDQKLVYRKRIRKKLTDYQKNIPP
ncbi:MAG: DNA polymerase II, partial [Kangiellaceae bacterium]|nr:DNA polymerase II [Kangiellaceae bacterium]